MKNHKLIVVLSILILFFSHGVCAAFFQSDGVKIYYTDSQGNGAPIVLVHGYSMSSDMWHDSAIVETLSKQHRVIALDCIGHGKSDKPMGPEKYGPKVGKEMINLIDHLEIKKAHLVGYSMGAYVVSRLLVTDPSKVQSAVIVSGFFPSNDREELLFQENTAKDMEAHGEPVLAAVARGWRYDAVFDEQIETITTPMQAVFGSEEINENFELQKARLNMPKLARPIIII